MPVLSTLRQIHPAVDLITNTFGTSEITAPDNFMRLTISELDVTKIQSAASHAMTASQAKHRIVT